MNCLNGRTLQVFKIREHFLYDKFLKNYTTWMIGIVNCHNCQVCFKSKCLLIPQYMTN